MYEYFGVGPYLLEDVDDMYPRFLRWLPKYHLSEPPKRSLQVWHMVIDNLTADDVSFFVLFSFLSGFVLFSLFYFFFYFFFLCCVVWLSFHSGFLMIFRCL